jgi:hypothetical protein
MAAQEHAPDYQWFVIDDGKTPTQCTMGQTVVRREPKPDDPPHTLAVNMRHGLAAIRAAIGEPDSVVIVEDDDYYGVRYLHLMGLMLQAAPLVGETGSKYWHVRRRGYKRLKPRGYAAFCRTGIRREALPALDDALISDHHSVDKRLWKGWRGRTHTFFDDEGDAQMCVGIKGLPGRTSQLHQLDQSYTPDERFEMLKHWVGDDWRVYENWSHRLATE